MSEETPLRSDLAVYWIFSRVLAAKFTLLVCVLVSLSLAGAYLSLSAKWYSSNTVLIPAERGPSGAGAQLGGLAALAGVNLSKSGDTAEAIAVLKSRGLLRDFIVENKLTFVIADRVTGIDDAAALEKAVSYFDKTIRSISEDRRAGTITLTVNWSDPRLAASWANGLVLKANSQLRKRALQAAESNTQFLREELGKANLPALQQSLSRLLESEMQTVLLAQSGDGFGFKVVDPAVPPERNYWPSKAVVVLLALLVALLAAIVVVLLREYNKEGGKAS